ncbi:glycosyltransferase, partial [Desulfovibrio sp. OttesenSCG-928-C06]|nr:glycosyltransferase [Desulfovibrio sp. OttesenSCG-928-C06]
RVNARRLRHNGYDYQWRDHAVRSHALSFCGVVDKHRPMRQAMLELLGKRFPLHRPEGRLDFSSMMKLFADSRIIPNESISREVNFRLFEGASCGSLVLSQNIGEDQDVCFTPEREVVLYENSLDLLDKCVFYVKHDKVAEKIARNARARVLAEHLPAHRAQETLDMAAELSSRPGARATGAAAEGAFYLTLLQLARHGSHKLNTPWLLKRMGEHAEDAESAAGILVLLAEAAMPESPLYRAELAALYKEQGLEFCRELARTGMHAQSVECNLAASSFALLTGEPELAFVFCQRQAGALAADETGATAKPDASDAPVSGFARFAAAVKTEEADAGKRLYAFYLDWAEVLTGCGYLAQPGFQMRIMRGFMPQTALECLFLAQTESEVGMEVNVDNSELMELLHRVCSRLPGYESMDMGFLAYLSLYDQQNWQLQASYGLGGLRCLKLEEPLCELVEAAGKAAGAGREADFFRLLAEAPASEYIIRVVRELLKV